ncbi:hypothetical protein CVT24_008074 [Panaeolus cyanescens]|uniref:Uncharacterized protein n=1 Tax=Panaeolus cyanescens TaxID=181874 RepID=A0A409W0I3_9AGAR|nr:hypothetical protein CVT24_008074 [Panaeolus cyanescens]
MPPLPSRKELESMKRADLQRICKDYGVKANLKSEALIDLLLDTQTAPTTHHPPPPQPQPPEPPRRSVSIRQPSLPKAGPSRTTSMIIHEPDEEEMDQHNVFKEPSPSPPLAPPPRTRKAKELQTRLGVGKPVAAGGSGPRAITRSSGSSSKGKRAKSSKSMKPKEAPIQEEPEPTHILSPEPDDHSAGEGNGMAPAEPQMQRQTTPKYDVLSIEEINRLIARTVQPLQDEIKALRTELQKVQGGDLQAKELKQQLNELNEIHKKVRHDLDNVKNIAAGIQTMKEEIQQLRDDFDDHAFFRPSTPKPTGHKAQSALGLGVPSAFRLGQALREVHGEDAPYDTATATTLGKRSRDVTQASQKLLEQNAKRPRIEKDEEIHESDEDNKAEEAPARRSFPAFSVYSGAEEPDDPPPPTTHLPHIFAPEPAGPPGRASSSQGVENQTRPFNFAFQPIPTTPNAFPSSFPYPEPPQSPSPAGIGQGGFLGQQSGRSDVFKQFGLPSPVRPSRLYGGVSDDRDVFINPTSLSQSDAGHSRDWLNATASGASKQRTMYGTELEDDTRFGDFGLEGGVAGGFWPNARF